MSALTTIVRRFAYPAQSPLASLTLYYTLLVAVSALLLWLVPDLREAFTGAHLADLAGQGHMFSTESTNMVAAPGEWLSWRFALLLGVAMLGAFLLMVPASWVYMATRRQKGFDQGVVQTEPVNDVETRVRCIDCRTPSTTRGLGALIQTAVGRLGGTGGWRTQRSGVAA